MTAVALIIRKYWPKILLVLLVIAAGVWAFRAIHSYGERQFTAGQNAVLASDARAAAQLQTQHDQLNAFSALATSALNQHLGTQLPAIQAHTNDTVETIRTVYRDRPVSDPACSRPAGVQASLDAAVDRANSAARGELRPDAGTGGAAPRATTAERGGHPGQR
jgi:hypothetical protein